MRKASHHTVSHTPNVSKHTPNCIICQQQDQRKSGQPLSKEKQQLVSCLVVIFAFIWIVAALITQNFFLLSGIPFLARELAYLLHRVVDVLLPL